MSSGSGVIRVVTGITIQKSSFTLPRSIGSATDLGCFPPDEDCCASGSGSGSDSVARLYAIPCIPDVLYPARLYLTVTDLDGTDPPGTGAGAFTVEFLSQSFPLDYDIAFGRWRINFEDPDLGYSYIIADFPSAAGLDEDNEPFCCMSGAIGFCSAGPGCFGGGDNFGSSGPTEPPCLAYNVNMVRVVSINPLHIEFETNYDSAMHAGKYIITE